MLVAEWQATAIAWGVGGGVALAAFIGALLLYQREVLAGAIALALLGMAGLLFSISKFGNGTRVLVVEQAAGGEMLRTDLRLYGGTAYRYKNGQNGELQWLTARQLIVNDTPRPLTLQIVRYGYGPSTESPIPAFASHSADGPIEFFGRSNQPPMQVRTVAHGDTKYWIYW